MRPIPNVEGRIAHIADAISDVEVTHIDTEHKSEIEGTTFVYAKRGGACCTIDGVLALAQMKTLVEFVDPR